MDISLAVVGALVLLALVDSTSIGTLVVPVWLLLSPRAPGPARMAVYLATVAAFYLTVGVLLLLGIDLISAVAGGLAEQTWLRWLQLVVGVALFGWAVFGPSQKANGSSGRLRRWRDRIAADTSTRGIVGLALLVTVVELAMMLPYLAALSTIASTDAGWPIRGILLVGYCVVMILPAAVLTAIRVVARARIDPWLERVDGWITRYSAESMAWLIGIVGFFLIGNAYGALF